jgi:hypothetical protein
MFYGNLVVGLPPLRVTGSAAPYGMTEDLTGRHRFVKSEAVKALSCPPKWRGVADQQCRQCQTS